MSYDGDAISDQEWSSFEEQDWERSLDNTVDCPKCNGTGRIDVLDTERVNEFTITPPAKTVDCDKCKGVGKIEVDREEEE